MIRTKLCFCGILRIDFFEDFKATILYTKDSTTNMEKIQSTLKIKELTKFKGLKVDDSSECLRVFRGRTESGGKSKYRSKSMSNEF